MQGLASVLPWVQVALSVLLVAAILLQQNEAGLGAAFGGGDGGGPNFRKRGIEKVMFIATIVIAILFALSALAPELLRLVSR